MALAKYADNAIDYILKFTGNGKYGVETTPHGSKVLGRYTAINFGVRGKSALRVFIPTVGVKLKIIGDRQLNDSCTRVRALK